MFFPSNKAHKGFTLIELLIVVAIIAILAAIAVPNFLEAQVRAKVARMQADMRTLATAIESYAVDRNSYPSSAHRSTGSISWLGGDNPSAAATAPAGYRLITTPVAYLASISKDVFSIGTGNTGWGTNGSPCPPQFFSGTKDQGSLALSAWVKRPRQLWMLVSIGPDLAMNTENKDEILPPSASTTNWNVNPWGNEDVFLVGSGPDSWEGVPYDTTNGTLSAGDLYRFAGDAAPTSFTE
jgi:prepilin-type N-terminal cleavage/methylation domain-containing protein